MPSRTSLEMSWRGVLARHPLSQWYVCPAAEGLALLLQRSRLRPCHLTALGLLVGLAGAAALTVWPTGGLMPAALVLGAWLCDRADGALARRQKTASAWGAWLDAQVDELLDVTWHAAAAWAVAQRTQAPWPWLLLAAFVAGKYLLVHSIWMESCALSGPGQPGTSGRPTDSEIAVGHRIGRWLWHLPGNADVRIHLLVAALATGWLGIELAWVALYYNLRWVVRYALVARRLGGRR